MSQEPEPYNVLWAPRTVGNKVPWLR